MASIPDFRTGSPIPSSGRASPVNPRLRQKDDEVLIRKDKAFKRWAATIERVLATFDQSVEEWADYISFLGRLLKALQTRPPNIDDVPFKLLVAKRLSQCLSPTLPSGVHQKALEVYSHIFELIGKDGLSRDISLYLPGLAPLVSFASLSVKPMVLNVFEEHLTKLDPVAVRPALKAIVLALLPALEEENSEEFERVLQILAAFKTRSGQAEIRSSAQTDATREQFFWQCLFLAGVTSSSRRSGALAYIVRNLPNLSVSTPNQNGTPEDQIANGEQLDGRIAAVAQQDPGLLIRCFCAGLLDENVLVQRGFLDILVERIPLNSPILQEKAPKEDLRRLIMAATSVVLRRDMSLNRRLWAWFLGPSAASENEDPKSPLSPIPATPKPPEVSQDRHYQIDYFTQNGMPMLVQALQKQFQSSSTTAADITRALRMCLALMDRFEIGNSIVSHVFVPALSSVQDFQATKALKTTKSEVLRSGNAFFDSVESFVIWKEVISIIDVAFSQPVTATTTRQLNFVLFLLSRFNVREEDMQNIHLPLAAIFVTQKLEGSLKQPNTMTTGQLETISIGFRVANSLVHNLLNRPSAASATETLRVTADDQTPGLDFAEKIRSFYSAPAATGTRPFLDDVVSAALLKATCATLAQALSRYRELSRAAVEGAVTLLDAASRKVPGHLQGDKLDPLIRELTTRSEASDHVGDNFGQNVSSDIALVLTITSVLEVLRAHESVQSEVTPELQRAIVPRLVRSVWLTLSPGRPQHHVEASRCLWRLHAITLGSDLVESAIVSLADLKEVKSAGSTTQLDHAQRFAVFWQQSQGQSDISKNRRGQVVRVQNTLTAGKLQLLGRPLFQMLDALLEADDDVSIFIAHWLEELPDLAVVVNVVLAHIDKATWPLTVAGPSGISSKTTDVDLDACIYFVRLLGKVVRCAKPSLENTLQRGASDDKKQQLLARFQFIIDTCIKIQTTRHPACQADTRQNLHLRRASLELLEQASQYLSADSLVRLKLDLVLLDELHLSIEHNDQALQIALTRATSAALVRRSDAERLIHETAVQAEEADAAQGIRRSSVANDHPDLTLGERQFAVPSKVLQCILAAFSSRGGRPVLDCWFDFLKETLQLYGHNIFQIILPLNECFCRVLRLMARDLIDTFVPGVSGDVHVNESAIIQVLNALERPLEISHGTLQELAAQANGPRNETPAASFFGMVSVLAPEGGKVKSSTDNNRLTVLLCFKDALRACFEIWSIDESSVPGISDDSTRLASFKYTTLRLRNRTRRIVEHLFQARDLECVETLVALWHDAMMEEDTAACNKVLALLSTVETARPKVTVPAIFNAIYSRTHPSALDPDKRSSLTSNVSEVTLTAFCIAYLRSLEDDVTDEIWQSCVTFLKDVLTSPLNHRQILVQLLELAVELGSKINNTNFGEQRKMKRELGDLFIRILSAITTIRPPGTSAEQKTVQKLTPADSYQWYKDLMLNGSADLVSILARVFPRLTDTLLERDRVAPLAASVSTQILGPILKSKGFPENVGSDALELLKVVGQIPEATKSYKKDVSDVFNEAKFFSNDPSLVIDGWLPVIRQWTIGDKERLPDLFSRLTAPAAAGLMFGVGASSARLEADRKTQLTLRRITTILLAGPQDAFVVNLPELTSKVVELLNANVASSPSSATRAEVYMLLRTLLLRMSPNHLNSLWPIINSELSEALSKAMPENQQDSLNIDSLLQLCKLIDTLLLLNLDEFQLQEWLFITDTTDAIYRPPHVEAAGLSDILAEQLDADPNGLSAAHLSGNTAEGVRKPLLSHMYVKKVRREDYKDRIFRPFFRQLSIASFEGNYSMDPPDQQACVDDLVADLFDDTTIA